MDESAGEQGRREIGRLFSRRGFGKAWMTVDILNDDVRGEELWSKGSGGVGSIEETVFFA